MRRGRAAARELSAAAAGKEAGAVGRAGLLRATGGGVDVALARVWIAVRRVCERGGGPAAPRRGPTQGEARGLAAPPLAHAWTRLKVYLVCVTICKYPEVERFTFVWASHLCTL